MMQGAFATTVPTVDLPMKTRVSRQILAIDREL
jgi:hypothetical protein